MTSALLHTLALLTAETAHAVNLTDAINQVGSTLTSGGGASFGDIIFNTALSFVPAINFIAALAITIAGFTLTLTGNENQQTTARRVAVAALSAVVLINVGALLVTSYLGVLGDPVGSAMTIRTEVFGLIAFFEYPLGVFCVVMIIISGIRAITSYGNEDGVASLRRTVIFVIAGFLLISTRFIVGTTVLGIGGGLIVTPTGIVSVIIGIANRIVFFASILAVAIIIYAAFMMILNVGREDQYSRAKGLIIRVGIGIIVMLSSLAIVNLLGGAVGGI